MGILEKIAEIEREISRTQKNKGEFSFCLRCRFFHKLNIGLPITDQACSIVKNKCSIWYEKNLAIVEIVNVV